MSKIASHEIRTSLVQAKDLIFEMLKTERKTGIRQTPILLGPPGNGKTSIVSQIVKDLDKEYTEKGLPGWDLVSMRLSQCDPTDLKGIPVYSKIDDHEVCAYAPPGNIPMVGMPHSAGGKNIILFLDELRQATPVIQNLAANIIDGVVGDCQIDLSRCFIVAASNRKEDKAAVFDVPRNVVSRLTFINVRVGVEEWKEWAIKSGQNPLVVGYLSEHEEIFNQTPPDEPIPYATPRGWHKVGAYMDYKGKNFFEATSSLNYLIGTVGNVGHQFLEFARAAYQKYSVLDIIEGKKVDIPTDKSILFSLVIQSCYKINNWLEGVASQLPPGSDKIKDLEQKGKLVVDALGDKNIEGINNIYKYFCVPEVDPAMKVVLQRYQNEICYSYLRDVMLTHPSFKQAAKSYEQIIKAMQQSSSS